MSNKNNKEEMENIFKAIFTNLLEKDRKNIESEYGEIIDKLISENQYIANLDIFEHLINYKIDKILNNIIEKINTEKIEENRYKINHLYKNINLYKNNITKIIVHNEGSCCSVDKAYRVLNEYKKYLLTGEYPKEDRFKEWINFCIGIYELGLGNVERFLGSYSRLLK